MMAVSPATLIPAKTHRHNHPCWRSPAVSATVQRRRHRRAKPPNNNGSEQESRGVGQAVLTALKSDPQGHSRPVSPSASKSEKEEEEALSGSDVLLALQRAAARRERRSGGKRRGVLRERGGGGGGGDAADSSEVRPLMVKSEWGVRLEEMERRLQDLLVQ